MDTQHQKDKSSDATTVAYPDLHPSPTADRGPVPAMPGGPTVQSTYSCILADPPWDVDQKGKLGAERHYDLMTLERIKAMPVASLAAPDSWCFLWVTNGTLRAGYDVLETWGFTPRVPFTWIKPKFGLGNYLRHASEHLLVGTRGHVKPNYRSQPTWMFAPVQDHSHKPEEFYAPIERLCDGPRLELFARRHQPGWDAWGNEIDSQISIPGYPVPSDAMRPTTAEKEGIRHGR
ncbi:MT-A70 family methyltransferase [Arthrobacter sp. ERGS1:01]|uniref:MT-A70 family methyltransferase n=1 Tax=Arthrobacter sp. ERGS1:01 TaxID=1704044 RepID=UPI000A5FBA2A|nr:MT-A70 family methyltransferase [Arthrobacter sp. ERGS1:01]